MATTKDLLTALGESILSSHELLGRLSVSRPTLSRLVADATPQVVRIGHSRATRYAAARSIDKVAVPIPVRRIASDGSPSTVGSLYPLAGRRHLLVQEASTVLYEGIPPVIEDMRPQGFLGRRFAERNSDLDLPPRVEDWSADDILLALSQRGEDAIGDLILGDASFDRWLSSAPSEVTRAEFPNRANAMALGDLGSSAGGEHPKFTAWSGGRQVLVKYAGGENEGPVALRWRDLLVCEALALKLLDEAGIPAARAEWFDVGAMRFLEVERFDRLGPRGRRGVVSLGAWDNEFLGAHRSWTSASIEMAARGELSPADARKVRWLDVFGDLIANSDRHFWNVTFFWDSVGTPVLAPCYDMLPMLFAPGATGIIDRPFSPAAPTSATLDVWAEAAEQAAIFWDRVNRSAEISPSFRQLAARCGEQLSRKRAELAHLTPAR